MTNDFYDFRFFLLKSRIDMMAFMQIYLRTSYDGRFFRPDVDYQDMKRSQEFES